MIQSADYPVRAVRRWMSGLAVAVLMLSSGTLQDPALAATRAMCEAGQCEIKPSRRGINWWRCCTTVPDGVLRKKGRQLCFHCSGESEKVNCDQLPQVGSDVDGAAAAPDQPQPADTTP